MGTSPANNQPRTWAVLRAHLPLSLPCWDRAMLQAWGREAGKLPWAKGHWGAGVCPENGNRFEEGSGAQVRHGAVEKAGV